MGLEKWREYFRKATSNDIFDIIEHAIMVAATDCPQEYRVRRDKIAELLYTCRLTRCLGCNHVQLAVNDDYDDDVKVVVGDGNDDDDDGGDGGGDVDVDVDVDVDGKGSKVNSVTRENGFDDGGDGDGGDGDGDDDDDDDEMMKMVNNEMNFSYGDAEALTDEIEEVKGVVDEVYRIKGVLNNSQDESDAVLLDSLRRLQLMPLTYDILKTTEIGKAVNRIRKHNSKEIRHLARSLIDGWKIIVDEWVKATQDLAGGTPDSVNPSTIDEEEEGLPSPPLDEGAFISTQTMDFSQFFDGMDDDGNPRNSEEFSKNPDVRDVGRKPSVAKQDPPKRRDLPKQAIPLAKDNKLQQPKRQEPPSQPSKPSNTQSGPGRPVKPNSEQKMVKDARFQPKLGKPNDQRRPPPQPERVRSSSDNAVQEKLEATKRKLQERYQQAENAKRQRTIQVMEIQDIPKQGLARPNPFSKFGNNRNWANGRK